MEARESGVGGFSFPVATPPAEPQADHHLFKSWPSVRSSCTSEVIAASDDDHVAADYADDGACDACVTHACPQHFRTHRA